MILCDTNILIEFYKNNETVKQNLRQIGLPDLAISVVTAGELYFGARDRRELTHLRNQAALLRQIPMNAEISEIFLELMAKYVLSHRLNVPDALIAATAIQNDMALYTLNIKDFRFIPGLQLYTP